HTSLRIVSMLIVLVATGFGSVAQAQVGAMPGFFHEFSANQNRAAVADAPNEMIDPFSGVLNLVHTDLMVPGNGGLDIAVNRVYSSNGVYRWGLKDVAGDGSLGRGWEMHMGRIRAPLNCGASPSQTSGNPVLEMSDGSQKQLLLNNVGLTDADYLTKDHWAVYCYNQSSLDSAYTVISPSGVKYTMDYLSNSYVTGDRQRLRLVTKIEDQNGNTLTIQYRASSFNSSDVLDRITASDGRVVNFSHSSNGRIRSVSTGGRTWQYTFDSNGNLTRVQRPEGQWNYSYHTSSGSDSYRLLRTVTHPAGAVVQYTYDKLCLSYVNCSSVNPDPQFRDSYSLVVSRKTQSGPSVNSGTWDYQYTRATSSSTTTDTTVNSEEGRTVYTHFSRAANGLWQVGLLKEKKIYEGSSLEQTETYEYVRGIKLTNQINRRLPFGIDNFTEPGVYAARMTKRTIRRDGTNYVTTYSNFSDGINPRSIQESGQASKTTSLTYYPRRNGQNIVSLVQNESFGGGNNEKITRSYDSKGNLTSQVEYGVRTTYGYDSSGNLTSIRDARGNTTRFSSYYRGVARSESQPESVSLSRTVNDFGQITRQTNGRGNNTNYSYDDLGRVRSISYPFGSNLQINWSSNQRSQTISRGSFSSTISYDGFGQEVCRQAEGIYLTKSYSTSGVLMFESLPTSGCSTSFGQYYSGVLGRMTRVRFEDSTSKTYSYLSSNRVNVVDERNKTFQFSYRSYGSPDDKVLIKVTGPESLSMTITRNTLGQPTRINRNGTLRNYTYNTLFLTSESNPETGSTVYGRDANGNMTSKRVAGAQQISYTYDARNRLKRTSYGSSAPQVNYSYDKNDNVTRVQSGITLFDYTYDSNDNLIKEEQVISGNRYFIQYRYNNIDHLERMTYPDARSVDFDPNDLGWPTQASPYVSAVSYNRYGQPTSIRYRNGRTMTQTYVARKWPLKTVVNGGIADRTRSYDASGNLLSMVDGINSQNNRSLSYDGLERLISASGPWGGGSVNYSTTDDITRKVMGTTTLNYSYDLSDKVSSISGLENFITPAQFAYDPNGNITQKANGSYGWTYDYDGASNLRKVYNKSGTLLRSYDYSGNKRLVRTIKNDGEGEERRIHIYTKGGQLINEFVTQGEKPNIANIYLGNRLVAEAESTSGPTTPPTVFGFGYGDSNHKYSYTTSFSLTKIPDVVNLCVDGYGINSTQEVSVTVNGVVVGHLLPGGDNTPRQTCIKLQPHQVRLGSNSVTFTQNFPGQTWGVGILSAVSGSKSIPVGAIMLLLGDENED
ncbi:MAG: RHS repeat domain-containing protein, partial [Arenicella sp.]